MARKGSVYIIPDENKILEEEFYYEVVKEHLEAFIDFSKKYKLNYNFTESDTQIAPFVIASEGNLVVKIEEESGIIVYYIPEIVTDRQNNWIHTNINKFQKYAFIGDFILNNNNNFEEAQRVKGIENIVKICDKRNINYEKKEDDNYVGKKI